MFRIKGDLYPHREHWPRSDREFFHHMMSSNMDDDPYLVPVKWLREWLEDSQINFTTMWEEKGDKFIIFDNRIDAMRFALTWT